MLRNLLVVIVLSIGTSCSTQPERKRDDPLAANLRRIGMAVQLCQDFKKRGPKDEAELKHWLKEIGERKGTPEEFMISERDGQPFVVFYGFAIDPEAHDVILAHETNGADGNRYVLTRTNRVQQLSYAEFAKARFATKKAAAQN